MFGSKIKGEISTCCNASVKRSPKLSGCKPYCTKCNKECEVKNLEIEGCCYDESDFFKKKNPFDVVNPYE